MKLHNVLYDAIYLTSGKGKIREKAVVSRGWGGD